MFPWITLALIVGFYGATRNVPTADEIRASFDHGQKFYSSGAYDQAIGEYRSIIGSRSSLLTMEGVTVSVGDIEAPLQEVATYQIGNAHLRMAEEALERRARARDLETQQDLQGQAADLLAEAIDYFELTEERATVEVLQALARSQIVSCHYKRGDYESTIEAARTLIERYPASKYVVQAMYDIGWAYFDMEEYASSAAAFERLVQRFPSGYRGNRALFQIGESYFRLERYRDAIPQFQRLVESQRIGQMSQRELLVMKREKLAGLVDETALELAAKAMIRLGECYERTGDYQEASLAFETVATQFQEEQRLAEEAYLRHADMHYNRGDFEACIAVYRRAIENDPDMGDKARLQLLMANRYFETEHYPEAALEYTIYRDTYAMWAAAAGLPVEGVGLQVARAWFRHAAGVESARRLDPYRRAEAELKSTLRAWPGSAYDVELRFNLGLALERQEDEAKITEALALYLALIEDPRSGGYRQSARFQAARILHDRQDFAAAADQYRQVILEMADRAEVQIARFELANVLRDAGRPDEAVAAYREVDPETELFARSRLEAGQSLFSAGRTGEAIPVLEEGLAPQGQADGETLALLHYLLGAAHSRLEQYEAAVPWFSRAIEDGVETVLEQAVYGRGLAYFRMGRLEEAAADLDRPWQQAEFLGSASRLLAACYTKLDRADEALEVYQRLALETETVLEEAEYRLAHAEIRYRQGGYEEVVEACRAIEALAVTETELPKSRPYYVLEKAWYLKADASLRLNRFADASGAAARGWQRFPGGYFAADFLFLRGLADLQRDDNESSVASFTRMLRRFPDHDNAPYALYYRGYGQFNQTMFREAEADFRRLLREHPEIDVAADAAFRAAECVYNLGRFAEAAGAYQAFHDRYPSTPLAEEALYNVAWCHLNLRGEQGRNEAVARRSLETYLEGYPGGRWASTARYTLAEIRYNAGEYDAAYGMFVEIEQEFPGTEAARRAAGALPDLREAVAYKAYEAAMEEFNLAVEGESDDGLRAVIPRLEVIWEEYPQTSSGIGARVNMAVAYQKLKRWKQAVDIYDEIVAASEGGAPVEPNVLAFCQRRSGTIKRRHL